ncbi:superoxide dismutase family protein [Streptomyces sp. NPDC017529]|uniref:superoxide dismutase family protein n=1 Tax=Streptomyces sp. NPDC017529 TaxID=3365000 RepID=UPI00379AF330
METWTTPSAKRTAKAAGVTGAALAAATALLLTPGPMSAAAAADGDGKVTKNSVNSEYAVTVAGQFTRPNGTRLGQALTYDPKLVPENSRITVSQRAGDKRTRVGLRVAGLVANRTYGAHVHKNACGARPDDSGPHYQHRKDPRTPSTDPAFANPKNEVWLDFTTNGKGEGFAESRHDWRFRAGEARSLVIHERRTATRQGVAGTAGRAVACYTVPFDSSTALPKNLSNVLSKIL